MAFSGQLGSGSLGAFELGILNASFSGDAASVLAFVSSATETVDYYRSADSVLEFVSAASSGNAGFGVLEFVSSTEAYVEHFVSEESILSFVSNSSETVDHYQSVEDILAFVQQAFTVQTASSILSFSSVATGNVDWVRSASSTLVLISTESETGPRRVSTASFLDLNSTSSGRNPTIYVDAHNYIPFISVVGRARNVSASSVLAFVSTGKRINPGTSVLSFVSTAVASRGLKSTLAFVQTVTRNVIYRRSTDSEINFLETLAYFVLSPDLECTYSLFVGSTTDPDPISPPSITVPVLGDGTLTLTYPFVTPTSTIILRNPDFGNSERLEFNRVQRETRGGTLVLFADRKWPKQQVLSLDISALSETQAQDFLDFIAESLGKEIGLLDYENRQWKGIIVNPDAALTDGGLDCTYASSLQFEGALV